MTKMNRRRARSDSVDSNNSASFIIFESATMTPAANVKVQLAPSTGPGGEAMELGGGEQHKTDGIRQYYLAKIDELEMVVNEKTKNMARLEAQRNQLNSKVRLLREELSLLQEQGSHVGEVVKAMDKKKVLVKGTLYNVFLTFFAKRGSFPLSPTFEFQF